MVIESTVQFDDRDAQRAFDELIKISQDARPALLAVGSDWFKWNRRIFRLKGPGKYEDLKDKYKKQKVKFMDSSSPYPILRGRFRRIEVGLTEKGSEFNVYEVTKTGATFGVKDIPYAIVHQKGSDTRKIPKRPFIFNAQEGGEEYKQQMKRWTNIFTVVTQRRLAKVKPKKGI